MEEDSCAQMETNYFGAFSIPTLSIYSACRYVLKNPFNALHQEVKGSGINITLIETAGYITDLGNHLRRSSLRKILPMHWCTIHFQRWQHGMHMEILPQPPPLLLSWLIDITRR